MSNWIPILQALLTPTIGVIAAYVAWQQYRLAKQKHDIDIFNRRMQVTQSFQRATECLIGQDLPRANRGVKSPNPKFEFWRLGPIRPFGHRSFAASVDQRIEQKNKRDRYVSRSFEENNSVPDFNVEE